MAKAKQAKTQAPAVDYGMVAYTDGGARPNPGYAGFGIHAYVYSNNTPKKGNGHSTQKLTASGYIPKQVDKSVDFHTSADQEEHSVEMPKQAIVVNKKPEVEVLRYIDHYGGFTMPATNNAAEILAAHRAVGLAKDLGLKELTIISDSKLVVGALETWLDKWEKNNWYSSSGKPIENQNLLKGLKTSVDEFTSAGAKLRSSWIRGHDGLAGNVQADLAATAGVYKVKALYPDMLGQNNASRDDTVGNFIEVSSVSPAQGYWSYKYPKKALLSLATMMFWANPQKVTEGEYYLNSFEKEHELYGSNSADASFAYVKANEPFEPLEMIRKWHIANKDSYDCIVIADVENIYDNHVNKMESLFGEVYYQKNEKRFGLKTLDEIMISQELRTPRISVRCLESGSILKGVLLAYQQGDDLICCTDVTPLFYSVEKGKLKLSASIGVGCASVRARITYHDEQSKPAATEVELTLGIDTLKRSNFKLLEELNPSIKVLSWKESDKMFRYATVIECDEGVAIYGGMFANNRYL